MRLPLVAARIIETPLMITGAKLDEIMAAVGERVGIAPAITGIANLEGIADLEPGAFVHAAPGATWLPDERHDRKPYQVTSDGIAVIEISGTLVNRAQGMAAWSGMTSYEQLSNEFLDAATDPVVKGILLRIDSPGGECSGVFDLADDIYSQRGSKPIVAIANDSACSAAYLLASQADKVIATQTAALGSVGVIAKHLNMAAADEKAGLKYTTVFAGARKNDLDPHGKQDDESFAPLQAEVDRLMDLFVAGVARGRGLSPEAIRAQEAGVFFGELAVSAGLADELGTLRSAMDGIRARIGLGPKTTAEAARPLAATKKEVVMAEITKPLDDEKEKEPVSTMPGDEIEDDEIEDGMKKKSATARLSASTILDMVRLTGLDGDLAMATAGKLVAMGSTETGITAEQVTAHLLKVRAESTPQIRSSAPLGANVLGKIEAATGRFMERAHTMVVQSARGLNPKTTAAYARATAESLALEADPALYDQYLAAHPAQTGGR